MKKETKNRNQKKEKKKRDQPGLNVLSRGGPWPSLEAPLLPIGVSNRD